MTNSVELIVAHKKKTRVRIKIKETCEKTPNKENDYNNVFPTQIFESSENPLQSIPTEESMHY